MVGPPDVKMGWLDRILDIHFEGRVLILGWFVQSTASGFAGTVSTPTLFVSATSSPLGWNNTVTVPVDNMITPPGPPGFTKGLREAYAPYDVTVTVNSHSTFHVVDLGIYQAFQAEPGGLTVITLTDPLDPAHFLVPFEIDQTNGGFGAGGLDGGKDVCGTIPGPWLDYHDRLNELDSFFPGHHTYVQRLTQELDGHNVTTDIDTKTRTVTRSVFVDFDQLAALVHNGVATIVVDIVGEQFLANGWCGIFPVEPSWPVGSPPAPQWNPPGLGPPTYTPDSFKLLFASSGSEGSTAHSRLTFTIDTAAKTVTGVVTHL